MLLNNRANATSSFLNLTNIILQQEFEDSIVEEAKSNIIKRYFEKRKKKKEIKEGQLSLESDRIKDLLNQKRLNFYNILYKGPQQYQFHWADLNFYLANFKDTLYKTELD